MSSSKRDAAYFRSVSYVLNNFHDGIDISLAKVMKDAKKHGIKDDMQLWSVQTGFEILNGGSGLKVSNFYVE